MDDYTEAVKSCSYMSPHQKKTKNFRIDQVMKNMDNNIPTVHSKPEPGR